jgi:NitT/TauT family transport system permease protein
MSTLLIQNAHTIATLNDAGDELKDASIFVRHNRIEAIGHAKDLPQTADQVINAEHHVVIPGMVNTHHHMSQSLTRAIPGVQNAELFGWLRGLYPIWAGLLPNMVYTSTQTAMAGFGIAIVVGVLLGFVIGSSRLAYAAVYPLMTAFNALPKAAFVPILVVWFGIGIGPAILTAFLISFFPIMVNIATGLATLEPELEDVLRVLGAKRWDVLVKVGLPRSMPYFFGSLKVAITLAFVGTTVSEMTAANEGIGYLLISAGSAMQMGLAFSGLVVVGAMAMVMYELFSYIEKHTTAWAHRSTNNE